MQLFLGTGLWCDMHSLQQADKPISLINNIVFLIAWQTNRQVKWAQEWKGLLEMFSMEGSYLDVVRRMKSNLSWYSSVSMLSSSPECSICFYSLGMTLTKKPQNDPYWWTFSTIFRTIQLSVSILSTPTAEAKESYHALPMQQVSPLLSAFALCLASAPKSGITPVLLCWTLSL